MDDKTLVERLIEFEKFIRGHDTLDGLWFGDTHSDFRGEFWWRRFSPIKEATDTIEAQATRIEALEDDLVEWKNQHENLLSVRQQDIAAMQAKIDTLEKELAFKNEAIRLTKGCPGKIVVRGVSTKSTATKANTPSKHWKDQAMVEVTDDDKRAAEAALPALLASIKGEEGGQSLTQAFATHRIEAAKAERDRIVAWLRDQDGYGEWYEAADALESQP